MSICKGCKGFNAGLGEYCPACLATAYRTGPKVSLERMAPEPSNSNRASPTDKVTLQVQPQESYDEWCDRMAAGILDKLDKVLR